MGNSTNTALGWIENELSFETFVYTFTTRYLHAVLFVFLDQRPNILTSVMWWLGGFAFIEDAVAFPTEGPGFQGISGLLEVSVAEFCSFFFLAKYFQLSKEGAEEMIALLSQWPNIRELREG